MNEIRCFNCKKAFIKALGVLKNENWYCSMACEPQIKEIYNEWKKKYVKSPEIVKKQEEWDLGLGDYDEKNTKIRDLNDFY